jgi:hypothetical protein
MEQKIPQVFAIRKSGELLGFIIVTIPGINSTWNTSKKGRKYKPIPKGPPPLLTISKV